MTSRLALLAAFLLIAGSAQAQINPFQGRKGAPRLADSDVTLLFQTGQKLLGDIKPAKGASETWQNDATGSAGRVDYLGPTTRKVDATKYACRLLLYEVTVKGAKTARTTRAAWCRLPDGTWKLG
jgi:surface antigen